MYGRKSYRRQYRRYKKKKFTKQVQNVIHRELDKNYTEVNYNGNYSLDKHQYVVLGTTYNYPLTVNLWNLINNVTPGTGQGRRSGNKIFINCFKIRVQLRLAEDWKSPYNTGATYTLKDPRVRIATVCPRKCAQGGPANYSEPFISRDNVDNPFECGFPGGSDSLSYQLDFQTFQIKSDKQFNTTVGGATPFFNFETVIYVKQHYEYNDRLSGPVTVASQRLWSKIPWVMVLPGQAKNANPVSHPYVYNINVKMTYTDA